VPSAWIPPGFSSLDHFGGTIGARTARRGGGDPEATMKRLAVIFLLPILLAGLLATPALASPVKRMEVPQPPPAALGDDATVRVFTYSGYECTLNDRLRQTNTAGGWMFWTFRVTYVGTARVKVWCGKGAESSAVVRYIKFVPQPKAWRAVVLYHGTGNWVGRDIRIPTADYRMYWWYACTAGSPTVLVALWHGTNTGIEGARFAKAGSGLWYGQKGARHGRFSVTTSPGCEWRLTVVSYY
jgi:hypothetical protein